LAEASKKVVCKAVWFSNRLFRPTKLSRNINSNTMNKKYAANGETCTVTFNLPAEAVHGGQSVMLLGDFNEWSVTNGIVLKQKKDGSFEAKLKLETGQRYEFRFLVDGERWENAWDADDYVPSPYEGIDNGVVEVPVPEKAAKKKKTAPKAKKESKKKTSKKGDDFKKIEGVGPKIASLLQEGGYKTFADLAKAKVKDLKSILEAAGKRYRIHDPSTWPEQAKLAAAEKWEELDKLQVELKGGKRK